MVFIGKQLNDLLEADGQPRSLNDDGRYVMIPGGKIIPLEKYLEMIKLTDVKELEKGSVFNAAMETMEKKDDKGD